MYEAQKRWLPDMANAIDPKSVIGVVDALADIDVVMLDAFGVLHAGQNALPGALEAVAQIRKSGREVRVVSNDATREKADLLKAWDERGFDFQAHEVVATVDMLSDELARYSDIKRWGVITRDGWLPQCLDPACQVITSETSSFEDYDGFLFIATFGWETEDTARLGESLLKNPRPIVVANPDIAAPKADGPMSTPPGYAAAILRHQTGQDIHYFGKPYPAMFRRAMDQFPNIEASRFLMVGDTLHTDVLGARAVGAKALLLTSSGFLRDQDWRAACKVSGIWPDFAAPSI